MNKVKLEKFSPYRSEFHFLVKLMAFFIKLFKHPLRYAFLFSALLHISIVGLFGTLKLINFTSDSNSPKTLNVMSISPETLKKLKTLGSKTGKEKDSFSLPAPRRKNAEQLPQKNENDLSLKSLGVAVNDIKGQSRPLPSKEVSKNKFNAQNLAEGLGSRSIKDIQATNNTEKAIIYGQTLRSIGLSTDEREVLSAAGLDMNFSPPKGVSEEELNSEEKVYYAFQKRAYTNYINSFISQYRRMTNIRPGIKKSLMNGKHQLTGKIIFDKDGNIVSSKVLKWSEDNDVQTLFDKTLENISSLPNPPESLLRDGQFVVYYQLYIGS